MNLCVRFGESDRCSQGFEPPSTRWPTGLRQRGGAPKPTCERCLSSRCGFAVQIRQFRGLDETGPGRGSLLGGSFTCPSTQSLVHALGNLKGTRATVHGAMLASFDDEGTSCSWSCPLGMEQIWQKLTILKWVWTRLGLGEADHVLVLLERCHLLR